VRQCFVIFLIFLQSAQLCEFQTVTHGELFMHGVEGNILNDARV